ncbi:MAG: alpha/beta fold hydrolase [Alphaproteobacteria bacterium]|nr:alpha/beta fold hydrolase [Alphaproteobacteria bacterium]
MSNYAPIAAGLQQINTNSATPPATVTASLALPCDIAVSKISYNTVGAAGEATTATAAVMVPVPVVPTNSKCNGPFPVVLAAHGTTPNKAYDTTAFAEGEASLYAAIFASQGYVVVAPNYAGYDTSTLPYHPYLILAQQSKDMQDALTAARRSGLFAANGKLFVTGYSQGGAVAMATQRDLEAAGVSLTASAPGSGPYAMLSFGDKIFEGKPNRGGTIFSPMLIDAAQIAYGNLYSTASDIYNPNFASTVPGLLPGIDLDVSTDTPKFTSFNTLKFANLLPTISPESGILGIGTNALFNSTARSNYKSDAGLNPVSGNTLPTKVDNPLRQALLKNDLRSGWVPKAPTLLCGADNDPSVFWDNTTQFVSYVQAKSATAPVSALNLNAAITASDSASSASLKNAFVAYGLNLSFTNAWTSLTVEVHGTMATLCYMAALVTFNTLRAQ